MQIASVDKRAAILARILLGTYFLYFFYSFLFSFDFLFGTSQLMDFITRTYDSKFLLIVKSAALVIGWLALLFSFLLTLGFLVRLSALVIWIGMIAVFNFNEVISQLQYPYLGLVLICYILFTEKKWLTTDFDFFGYLGIGYWREILAKILYLTIFISGFSKFLVADWRGGTISKDLCGQAILSQININFCNSPMWLFKFLTLFVLFSEIGAIFYFFKRFKFRIWILQCLLQVGFFIFVPVANVTTAMLIFLLFVYHSDLFKDDKLFRIIAKSRNALQ